MQFSAPNLRSEVCRSCLQIWDSLSKGLSFSRRLDILADGVAAGQLLWQQVCDWYAEFTVDRVTQTV
jgi:hypothetical protein